MGNQKKGRKQTETLNSDFNSTIKMKRRNEKINGERGIGNSLLVLLVLEGFIFLR